MQSTEAKRGRRAGIGMCGTAGLLIVLSLVRGGSVSPVLPLLLGAVLALTLVRPAWLAPAERLATLLQSAFGWCLMAIAYFVILTPAALLRRLIERDPLGMRLERRLSSYWVERPPEPNWPERLSRPY